MLTLEQLSAFKAAAETGSFTKAAKRKGKGLNTISNSIINLEDYLGFKLFDRTGRYPKLTDEGERLYAQVKVLFAQLDTIIHSSTDAMSQIETSVRIGLGELIPTQLFETLVQKVSVKYPNTKLILIRGTAERLHQSLLNEELDLGVMVSKGNPPDGVKLLDTGLLNMVLACSADSELAQGPAVSQQRLQATRQVVCQSILDNPLLANYMLFSPNYWETTSLDDSVAMVEQDIGWACLPELLVNEKAAAGSLVRFDCDFLGEQNSKIQVYLDLVVPEHAESGPVSRFLLKTLQELLFSKADA
ncbi:LysR family transcriptional regulator [Paraferrimonas sedimenticola]|uniref:Transcriptional regulator n=1 Tax=Paraferrimonas sedimenticola TaxID=375674 RepID=A0AA37RWG8_9GAMM|nr:LysR family transcriptional regulator [Paraferrimonas sedimenticola]GLP96353.1 transcriptional regulator [Paraferrimonas sedimenticola]